MAVWLRRGKDWRFIVVMLAAASIASALYYSTSLARSDATRRPEAGQRDLGRPHSLPLPSTLTVMQFEEKLFEFLNNREYHKLGWVRDKGVRDTGSFIGGKYYGTHPAVRIYYSPGIIRWLLNDRAGKIPDGEMIVKEQFAPPAIRHHTKSEDDLLKSLESWTVMIKDSAGSHDGWFWSNPVKGQCTVDPHRYPYDYPVSGFGQYCVRCHAATQSPGVEPASAANEFTFAHLRNIAGFPGQPMIFRVDDTWRAEAQKEQSAEARTDAHPKCARPEAPPKPVHTPNPRFLSFFSSIKTFPITEVSHLPPVTHDWVVNRRDPKTEFMTSNQCMNCHSGLTAPFGPSMFVPKGPSHGLRRVGLGRVALWRMALHADGARRSRPDLLCSTRMRDPIDPWAVEGHSGHRRSHGGDARGCLPSLPRRDGPAAIRPRSSRWQKADVA